MNKGAVSGPLADRASGYFQNGRSSSISIDPLRNPDASRYFCAPGGGVLAPHDWCGRYGSSGNGDRLRVASVGALPRRSLRRNKYGRDRNGCRSVPGPGSPDTRIVAPAFHRHSRGHPRPAARPQADAVDAIPPGCDDAPAFVLRHGVWGTAPMRTATLGSVPCLPCDIGTVLSRQPITLSGARLRELVKTQPKFRELEDRGTVCGAAIRIAVASIKMSVGRL
jgi:hypothetical protein